MKNLLAIALLTFASVAAAHTELVSSVPRSKSTVSAPVKEVMLEFEGDVRLTAVVLTDSQGAMKKVGAVPTAVAKKFTMPVQDALAPGDYTVTWRAVGADTHVVTGEVRFKVAAEAL
jgi:copper resistance protein C